jgi:hypothetical protein
VALSALALSAPSHAAPEGSGSNIEIALKLVDIRGEDWANTKALASLHEFPELNGQADAAESYAEFADSMTGAQVKQIDPSSDWAMAGNLTPDQSGTIAGILKKLEGVNVLGAHSLTVESGTLATVALTKDFTYATEYAPDKKTPSKTATKSLGITVSIRPAITKTARGSAGVSLYINLDSVRLLGFLGNGGKQFAPEGHAAELSASGPVFLTK